MQFTSSILALLADGIANKLSKKRLDWGVTWDQAGLWLVVRVQAPGKEAELVKELLANAPSKGEEEARCVN